MHGETDHCWSLTSPLVADLSTVHLLAAGNALFFRSSFQVLWEFAATGVPPKCKCLAKMLLLLCRFRLESVSIKCRRALCHALQIG